MSIVSNKLLDTPSNNSCIFSTMEIAPKEFTEWIREKENEVGGTRLNLSHHALRGCDKPGYFSRQLCILLCRSTALVEIIRSASPPWTGRATGHGRSCRLHSLDRKILRFSSCHWELNTRFYIPNCSTAANQCPARINSGQSN